MIKILFIREKSDERSTTILLFILWLKINIVVFLCAKLWINEYYWHNNIINIVFLLDWHSVSVYLSLYNVMV